jgi:hypothetical protein
MKRSKLSLKKHRDGKTIKTSLLSWSSTYSKLIRFKKELRSFQNLMLGSTRNTSAKST